MNESQRGTGRTSRMLIAASAQALQNPYEIVYVIFNNSSEFKLWNHFRYSIPNLVFRSSADEWINWLTLEVRGVPKKNVFFDHFAIEKRYQLLLQEMHRWDSAVVRDHDLKVLVEVKHV